MRLTFILLHVDIHFAQRRSLERIYFPQPISDNFYKTIPGCKCVAVLWGLPFYHIHLHMSKLSYFSHSQLFSFEFIIYLQEAVILTLNSVSSLACPSSSLGSRCHLLHLQTVMHSKLSTMPIKWASLYLHFSTYSNLFSTFQQERIFLDF